MNNIVICPNCKAENLTTSKFCIKCGTALNINNPINQINQEPMQTQTPTQTAQNIDSNTIPTLNATPETLQTETPEQPINPTVQPVNQVKTEALSNNQQNVSASILFSEYFFILLAVILKPFTAFKEEINKFNEFKNSAILSIIVSGCATIITLVTTMISAARTTSYSFLSGTSTSWNFENLKDIEYIKVIGTSFLTYLGIILAIAVVYYIGSLIIKKQLSFPRLLGIAAAAIVPAIICSMVLSPLLSMIHVILGLVITVIGFIYTVIIIYEMFNQQLMIDGDLKLYFNLVCLSILGIGGYYILVSILLSSTLGSIGGFLNSFGF